MVRVLVLVFCVLCIRVSLPKEDLLAQQITVGSVVTASPPEGGDHLWYEIHAEPDDSKNMIICGAKWDGHDDAWYGFVYYSPDGGKSWTRALEDKNTRWVSEQSCAYGVHGIAYFVSDASKVIDEFTHHDLGVTRLYVSRDSGKTWDVGTKTGWTDVSTSVVDTTPGPNQDRLYVFFNDPALFYESTGHKELADPQIAEIKKGNAGAQVGMISYRAGDNRVEGPLGSDDIAKERNHGVFPGPALLLNDGAILNFYTTMQNEVEGSEEFAYTAEVVRTSVDRSSFEEPVKIFDSRDNARYNEDCGYEVFETAAAYNSAHNTLYLISQKVDNKGCHLFLTTSLDGGRSWSDGKQIRSPDETSMSAYIHPTLAVNSDGVIAVMWERKQRSGCWMFAVSEDGGASLSRAKHLGTCAREAEDTGVLWDANLWSAITQAKSVLGSSGGAKISLRNTRNDVERIEHAIAVTHDGVFHPVWIDAGNGMGEIRTAAIHITPSDTLIASGTKRLTEITNQVAVLYGGNQHYDVRTRILTVDVAIQNKSTEPIHGPLRLAVPSFFENYGHSTVLNAANNVVGAGAVWDISSAVPDSLLQPGATSKPFPLKFRYRLLDVDKGRPFNEEFLRFTLKVFAGSR